MQSARRQPRFGIVVSRFNGDLTRNLHRGALAAFRRHQIPASRVDTVWVPGAFEIPVVAHALATSRRYGALVALGALIKGTTHHYDAICREVSRGLAETARTTGVPVGFGVIMVLRRADAVARSGHPWNLGTEAAEAAITMAAIMRHGACADAARRANTR